jgi:hypothetical protein
VYIVFAFQSLTERITWDEPWVVSLLWFTLQVFSFRAIQVGHKERPTNAFFFTQKSLPLTLRILTRSGRRAR